MHILSFIYLFYTEKVVKLQKNVTLTKPRHHHGPQVGNIVSFPERCHSSSNTILKGQGNKNLRRLADNSWEPEPGEQMFPTHPGLQYCNIHSEALQLPGCSEARHSSSNDNNFASLFSCREKILPISSGRNFTAIYLIYDVETELTGQRLDPFVNTKVNQAVSFQVAVYPVDQHSITWRGTSDVTCHVSLYCFLDKEKAEII